MSTRTRIILSNKDGSYMQVGWRAVSEVVARATNSKGGKTFLKSFQFAGLTKREKLLRLMPKLPPGFKLVLIQEPKNTRKSKSLYWKNRMPNYGNR